ncbi:MAG: hypothetical protein ACKKMS_01275 [Candidatus Nealsonbacteria bacterium]
MNKGIITIIAFFSLGILLLLSVYFLSFALTESKISKSQEAGNRAYYLAEAGINQAIWKLKNDEIATAGDPAWKSDFITKPGCENWSANFEKTDPLFPNSFYRVEIQNSACGRGRIVSKATINLNGKTAQRVIKTTVFKALADPLEKAAIFAGGKELKIKRSQVRVYDGNIFSNGKLVIENFSNVEVHSPGGNALFAGCTGKEKELKIKRSDLKVYDGNIFSNEALKIEDFSNVEVHNGKGNALFAGEKELKVKDSSVKIGEQGVDGANIFSNEKIKIEGWLTHLVVNDDPDTKDDPETEIIENLEGIAFAVDRLEFKHGAADSNLTAEAVCASDRCDPNCPTGRCPPPPEALEPTVSVPMVDFDSDYPECDNPNSHSFKCRAQEAENSAQCKVLGYDDTDTKVLSDSRCVFSEDDFKTLLWNVGEGGKLVLNSEITYVDKNVELKGGRHLVVNGALVAKEIKIGNKLEWKEHDEPSQYGDSSVTVCDPDYITDCTTWCQNHPCGLLAKKKIEFGKYSFFWHDIDITGVLYAIEEIKVTSILQYFDIKGAIIGGKVKIESKIYTWFDITYDKDIVWYGLGWEPEPPQFSPIINIEHWEETY